MLEVGEKGITVGTHRNATTRGRWLVFHLAWWTRFLGSKFSYVFIVLLYYYTCSGVISFSVFRSDNVLDVFPRWISNELLNMMFMYLIFGFNIHVAVGYYIFFLSALPYCFFKFISWINEGRPSLGITTLCGIYVLKLLFLVTPAVPTPRPLLILKSVKTTFHVNRYVVLSLHIFYDTCATLWIKILNYSTSKICSLLFKLVLIYLYTYGLETNWLK